MFRDVPIFMYHALGDAGVGGCTAVRLDVFERQMRFICDAGYNALPLETYAACLRDGRPVPRRSVVITFDDGFADNLPGFEILSRLKLPASVFVPVDSIGRPGYLTQSDLQRGLKMGIRIGSHTITHAYLPDLCLEEQEREIVQSRHVLREMFGVPVETFAYPVSGFDRRIMAMVREAGYICAVATNRGYDRGRDIFALRRIKMTDRDLGARLRLKLSGFYTALHRPKKPC
jgi:peptidoglycan/xylan/chitin deacetylase (PgdA/CDA1 family)